MTITSQNADQVSALASWQESAVTDLAWSPDGKQLAVATFEGISIVDVRNRIRRQHLESRGGVISLDYHPNGFILAEGNRSGSEAEGYTGNVVIWQVGSWEPVRVFYNYNQAVSQVDFSPGGSLLAVAFSRPEIEPVEENITFWDTASWEITRTLSTGLTLEIAFSPDGKLLATTPDRYAIQIWQTTNGALRRSIYTSFTGAVNCIRFSPDGKILAAGTYDGVIRLWEVASGNLLQSLEPGGVITSLAFSPDGSILAAGEGYRDHHLRLWAVSSGQLLRELEGHTHAVDSLAFSPNGEFLASASYDGSVRLWGLRP